MKNKNQINILLADDDKDDTFFFARALKSVSVATKITCVGDGEELLSYLSKHSSPPDVLFLDVNMPRKNGLESLIEIKANTTLKDFPIIIYSTSLSESSADIFYKEGAHYYIKKCDFDELVRYLEFVLVELTTTNFKRGARDKFVLSLPGI